ncbi:MAG: HD-GYP domain-containing protein, partial [Solirubrobacteraceae bacterium]
MLLATFAVAVVPTLVVSAIQLTGRLNGVTSFVVAMCLALAAGLAGSALWSRRPGSRDVVFADLMLWGWIRRLRTERRLADATQLLGLAGPDSRSDRRVELLEQLATALEARDPYTHGHSRRVARHAHMIARQMGLSGAQVATIRSAAALHDVGKVETPRAVLNKPGRLTDEEFATIKRHPVDGAEMVAVLGDPELAAIVRHHHERLDGRGYPDGLAGEQIPLGARIIAVADTFDAITSSRPYRRALAHKKAIDTLKREAGAQLDAAVVSAFLSYYSGRRRSLPWLAVIADGPQRGLAWLAGALHGAGAAPLAKGASAVGVSALVGGSLLG